MELRSVIQDREQQYNVPRPIRPQSCAGKWGRTVLPFCHFRIMTGYYVLRFVADVKPTQSQHCLAFHGTMDNGEAPPRLHTHTETKSIVGIGRLINE